MSEQLYILGQKRKGARWYVFGPTIQAVPSLHYSPLRLVTPEQADKLLPILRLNHPTWNWKLEPVVDKTAPVKYAYHGAQRKRKE